jgi:hypothetical protein
MTAGRAPTSREERDGAFERAIGPEKTRSRNGYARLSSPDGSSRRPRAKPADPSFLAKQESRAPPSSAGAAALRVRAHVASDGWIA